MVVPSYSSCWFSVAVAFASWWSIMAVRAGGPCRRHPLWSCCVSLSSSPLSMVIDYRRCCASWSGLVVRCRPRGWPSHLVIHRCPWWYALSVVMAVLVHCLLGARPSWSWSVVSFMLVSCGRSPFVRARSGEERAVYLPELSFCNATRALRLSLTSSLFLM